MDIFKREVLKYFADNSSDVLNFKNLIQNKRVTVLLGNTRCGKSTLVNYLIGTKLEAFESNKIYRIQKTKREQSNDGPKIEHESLSCTTSCSIYYKRGSREYIIDSPGFEDNRGEAQNIINTYFINQLQFAYCVKFVVVFDINDLLQDNVRNFTKTLDYVQNLVSNFSQCKRSFCFIFTKDSREYTQSEIGACLKSKILDTESLNFNKTLVQHLYQNIHLIGLFRMPTKVGPISSAIDMNVTGAIGNTQAIDLSNCKIVPVISENTQQSLLKIYPKYTDKNYFKDLVGKLIEPYKKYFDIDKYVYASLKRELEDTKEALITLRGKLTNAVNRKLNCLSVVQNSLESLFMGPLNNYIVWFLNCRFDIPATFRDNFKFVVILDESGLLDSSTRSVIINNYIETLRAQLCCINRLIKKINDEQASRSDLDNTVGIGMALTVLGAPLLLLTMVGGLTALGAGFTTLVQTYKIRVIERAEERERQHRIEGREIEF